MTLDEILELAKGAEPWADRAWRELCLAAVNLGVALAEFENASKVYVVALKETAKFQAALSGRSDFICARSGPDPQIPR